MFLRIRRKLNDFWGCEEHMKHQHPLHPNGALSRVLFVPKLEEWERSKSKSMETLKQ